MLVNISVAYNLYSFSECFRGTGSRQPGWFDVVSTSWIKELNVELLKLHPGWSETLRSERRTSCWFKAWWNLLRDQHPGLRHRRAFAKRVETLIQRGVTGGQGDFFASSQHLILT